MIFSTLVVHRTCRTEALALVMLLTVPFLFLGCGEEGPDPEEERRAAAYPWEPDFLAVEAIVANKCALDFCHGAITAPDTDFSFGASRQRLVAEDVEQTFQTTSINGVAMVDPGSPETSYLYLSIVSTDPEIQMPPPGSLRITEREIEAIRDWIASGAKYRQP